MRQTLLIVFGLVVAFSVQAASFDCDKAVTKVERLICADSELSKLDEELAAAYKTALQDEKRAEPIRRTQKQWMKERNDCADEACVKHAYEGRITSLKSSSGRKVKSSLSGQWHLEICDINISKECGRFTVYLVQIGNKICGDHFFATPGGGRLNEGAPRSIIGSMSEGNIADMVITSGRNGAVFKVRVIKNGDTLNWAITEEVKLGLDGDSALVLNKGNLRRETENSSYRSALAECRHL